MKKIRFPEVKKYIFLKCISLKKLGVSYTFVYIIILYKNVVLKLKSVRCTYKLCATEIVYSFYNL